MHVGTVLLQYAMLVFNTIFAPFFVVALTDPDCFFMLLSPSNPIHIVTSFRACGAIPNVDNVPVYCVPVEEDISFSPPFMYSSQCSSSLITTYVPAFVIQFTCTGIILPAVNLLLPYIVRGLSYEETHNSLRTNLLRCFVQKRFWSIPTLESNEENLLYFSSHLIGARSMLGRIISALSVLLTFGICYPLLGCLIALNICTQTLVMYITIQRHVTYCPEAQLCYLQICLERDCVELQNMFGYVSDLSTLLLICSCFFALMLLDMTRSFVVFASALLLPLCWLCGTKMWYNIRSKKTAKDSKVMAGASSGVYSALIDELHDDEADMISNSRKSESCFHS